MNRLSNPFIISGYEGERYLFRLRPVFGVLDTKGVLIK